MAKIVLDRRSKIRARIRSKVVGTISRPRLSVFRSNRQVYAQIIDDGTGQTLVGRGTFKMPKATKKDQSYELGLQLAKLAREKKIAQIVFDRGGYVYHGRVEALARGLRAGGLKF